MTSFKLEVLELITVTAMERGESDQQIYYFQNSEQIIHVAEFCFNIMALYECHSEQQFNKIMCFHIHRKTRQPESPLGRPYGAYP